MDPESGRLSFEGKPPCGVRHFLLRTWEVDGLRKKLYLHFHELVVEVWLHYQRIGQKPGIAVYACSLSTWVSEEGGPQVQGQPEVYTGKLSSTTQRSTDCVVMKLAVTGTWSSTEAMPIFMSRASHQLYSP